jgi:hypothetical protein
MRAFELKLQPQQIKISAEEILADLNYPSPAVRLQAGRGRVAAPRGSAR